MIKNAIFWFLNIGSFENSCRICFETEENIDTLNELKKKRLIHPCLCKGSMKFVHETCLKDWLQKSPSEACQICNFPYRITKRKTFTQSLTFLFTLAFWKWMSVIWTGIQTYYSPPFYEFLNSYVTLFLAFLAVYIGICLLIVEYLHFRMLHIKNVPDITKIRIWSEKLMKINLFAILVWFTFIIQILNKLIDYKVKLIKIKIRQQLANKLVRLSLQTNLLCLFAHLN